MIKTDGITQLPLQAEMPGLFCFLMDEIYGGVSQNSITTDFYNLKGRVTSYRLVLKHRRIVTREDIESFYQPNPELCDMQN